MKAQSNVFPESIWIKDIVDGIATIHLTKGIIAFENEEETFYEYEETQVKISDRENLHEYVEEWFEELFAKGLEKENKPKELTLKEENAILKEENKRLHQEDLNNKDAIFELYSMLLGGL